MTTDDYINDEEVQAQARDFIGNCSYLTKHSARWLLAIAVEECRRRGWTSTEIREYIEAWL